MNSAAGQVLVSTEDREMTEFSLSLTGLHSRNESTIQATQDWERGRIDARSLKAAFAADCDSLVALQTDLGAEYVSDGQMNTSWQDALTPLTAGLTGIEKGAMVRWYNTNTFYYTPVVKGPISSEGGALLRAVQTKHAKSKNLRVSIPDPLTFAELAEDHYYGSFEKVLFAYADALRAEFRALQAGGVAYVQFTSPALVARFREKRLSEDALVQLGEAVRSAKTGSSLRTGYHAIFGDASPYLPRLFDILPTDDIGFDFTQTDPASLSPTRKGIIAGVADARTTYLESLGELRSAVDKVVERTGSRHITLAPSSDLRYIPRVAADAKVRRLGALRKELAG